MATRFGLLGLQTNGFSEQWALGLMGLRNNEQLPIKCIIEQIVGGDGKYDW